MAKEDLKSKSKKAKSKKITKDDLPKYGSIVFLIGVLISLITPAINFGNKEKVSLVLFLTLGIIGIIVGILNITNKEVVVFLLSSLIVVMLLATYFGALVQVIGFGGGYLKGLYENIILLIVPAALVVALKTLFIVAKDE